MSLLFDTCAGFADFLFWSFTKGWTGPVFPSFQAHQSYLSTGSTRSFNALHHPTPDPRAPAFLSHRVRGNYMEATKTQVLGPPKFRPTRQLPVVLLQKVESNDPNQLSHSSFCNGDGATVTTCWVCERILERGWLVCSDKAI